MTAAIIQAVDRLIQFNAQFDLSADPIEVGDLPAPTFKNIDNAFQGPLPASYVYLKTIGHW